MRWGSAPPLDVTKCDSRSSVRARWVPRLDCATAWISSTITTSVPARISRAPDVIIRYSDSGVVIRVFAPAAILGHPSACAGVGASNEASNQRRTVSENGIRGNSAVVLASVANPPILRIDRRGTSLWVSCGDNRRSSPIGAQAEPSGSADGRLLVTWRPPALPRERLGDFSESGSGAVARREDRVRDRPVDGDLGIVPSEAALPRRVVVAGELVGDVSHLARDDEAVREA